MYNSSDGSEFLKINIINCSYVVKVFHLNGKGSITIRTHSNCSTYISSSGSFFSAFLAIHWKAASTLNPSLADVSKYGMFPFEAHHALAFFSETWKPKYWKKKKNQQRNKQTEKKNIVQTDFSNYNIDFNMKRNPLTTLLFPPSTSILFPNTTNGKFSGSDGLAWK